MSNCLQTMLNDPGFHAARSDQRFGPLIGNLKLSDKSRLTAKCLPDCFNTSA